VYKKHESRKIIGRSPSWRHPPSKSPPSLYSFINFIESCQDVDDLGKLKRVMRYMRDTKDLALTLEADDDGVVRCGSMLHLRYIPICKAIVAQY
jgi:hypothetical protein